VVVAPSPTEPVKVTVPLTEEVRYLEVKEAATKAVITTIEILSPLTSGDGRQKYEVKRQRVLRSQTHLVEIDLLRAGDPLPVVEDLPPESLSHFGQPCRPNCRFVPVQFA